MSIPISAYFWSMQKMSLFIIWQQGFHLWAFHDLCLHVWNVAICGVWTQWGGTLHQDAQDDTNQSWNAQISGQQQVKVVGGLLKQFDRHFLWWWFLPRILLMLELCISGQFFRILRRSSLAQIINAFMGRLMWGLLSLSFLGWRIILAPKKYGKLKQKEWENRSNGLGNYDQINFQMSQNGRNW